MEKIYSGGLNFMADETTSSKRGRKPKAESNEKKQQRAERIFKQSQQLHHDLYVLEPAEMKKDTSIGKTGDPRFLHPITHQHFYHSIDQTGKKLNHSSMIGMHFHEMEVVEQLDGPPKVICKSGPLVWGRKKHPHTGKWMRVKVPVNAYDDHRHEVTYLQSEIITPRKANPEAAVVIAKTSEKETAAHMKIPKGEGSIEEG